ncbi:hypothetical protein FIBSPDRAFT_873814 [Athelia psychrophila]|uniref:Uncharacterized protein n=1 Tax=Athelia psychrophila TaxID=1759441 RepID=A0A165Y4H0_9AGAM|nr:hypothetical protein FIBSPDRAFT_873814 [Fibularhizoctonia sp. CBS 109695]
MLSSTDIDIAGPTPLDFEDALVSAHYEHLQSPVSRESLLSSRIMYALAIALVLVLD